MTVRVRFAPSPTGHLHVGNVRTALYNWLFARQHHGAFLLRIEDTDLARSEQQYETQLMEDLKWLGLDWDEGVDVGGAFGPYRQTDRFPLYRQKAQELLESGKAYYCFCSRQDLEREREEQLAAGLQPRYPGTCRALSPERARQRKDSGEPAALRLRVREGVVSFRDRIFGEVSVDCSTIGDFILLRSDESAQYNFACVVDDALMKISHVIRGEGHLSNTSRQLLVYEALGVAPPEFAHLSTILGPDGSKLSKRHGATSIEELRRQGYLPEAILNYLALLGWASREEGREIFTLEELVKEFDLDRVHRSPAIFDQEKFNWVNRNHLKNCGKDRLARLSLPYLQKNHLVPAGPSAEVLAWIGDLAEAFLSYLDKLEDLVSQVELIFRFEPETHLEEPEVREVLSQRKGVEVIRAWKEELEQREGIDLGAYRQVVQKVKQVTGCKGKDLLRPIRIAVTGRFSGPELELLIPLLERGAALSLPHPVLSCRERARKVLNFLEGKEKEPAQGRGVRGER